MNRLLNIILVFIFIGNTPLFAQNLGTITGIIADSITQEPLLGVTVIAGDNTTSSDYIDGKYELKLPVGEHAIVFSYLGYQSKTKIVTVEGGKAVVMNITMSEESTLIGTVTVSSSKFEKSLGEATVSIDVIQPTLIENTNAQAVNEVLDKVPGVNTMGDQVTIRGGAGFAQGTGSRVLVLMDDMPAMQADAGLPNWSDLPTENIAQMEVLKGAASALYGSAALNGVINIRTAYPLKKPLTKISIFGTMYGDPKNADNKWWTGKNMPFATGVQFAHRRKWGKFDIVLGSNLAYNQSFMRGFRTLPDGSIDSMPGYNNRARLTANLRYRHSEKLIFTLNTNVNLGAQSVFLFHNRVDPNLGLYETDFDPAPRGASMRMTIDPAVTIYDNAEGRHRVQLRYFYIDNNNEANQSNSSNMFYGEYQYQRKFAALEGLEVAAGLVGSTISSISEVYANEQYRHSNFAAYLQLDKKFFKKLNVSFGARYELNATAYPDSINYDIEFQGNVLGSRSVALRDTIEHRPVFRVGLSYQLTKGTFLRASFGQGYRFPTVLEKFISTAAGGITIAPNPSLNSETGWSAEFGVKQGFKIGKWQGFVDLAGFWTEYDNMMEFQASKEINSQFFGIPVAFQVQNIGNTRITGFDLSVMGQGNIGPVEINLLAGYTFLNPEYREFQDSVTQAEIVEFSTVDYNVLKYRNRHTVKTDLQAVFKGIALGITLQYLSFMEGIDSFLEGEGTSLNPYTKIHDFRQENRDGSFVLNMRASYQIKKFVKVSFLVNNMLNNEIAIQPGKLEAPVNFTMRGDFTF